MGTELKGIVVAGNSLEEAQALYRAVATGQDVKALHDKEDTFVVLSSGSSDISIINPLTGEDDLVVGDGLTDKLEFLASDSDSPVPTNYTICVDGCGAHVIADDASMLKHCPSCATAITDLTEEEIEAYAAAQGEDEEGCEGCEANASNEQEQDTDEQKESVVAVAATAEEAVAAYRRLITGEEEALAFDCGDTIVSANELPFDVYTGKASTQIEDHVSAQLESLSSSTDELHAHLFVCSSSACGAHVASSDDLPVFCPSCSSGLIDPEDEALEESLSSDEDDEEDEDLHESLSADDDEEDEEDLDEDEDEEDEDEDDIDEEEDDDDSDDEDYEDDDSDEDEDDYEEDEDADSDEEEEDEEDEDDDGSDVTLSVSSVSSVRMKSEASAKPKAQRARHKAQASAAQEEEQFVSLSASFLSLAGDLNADKLDVRYVGNVAGQNTWLAMYDGIPVARALASNTKHPDIFESEVFGRAVKAQASSEGVQVALDAMAFEEIKPVIDVQEHVKNEIETQVAKQTEAVATAAAQDKAELAERFGNAIALAAVGLNKNFFVGKTNPVKQALISSLSTVGFDNAEALVSQAFAQRNDELVQMIMAKASEIMGYNLETQNQLAEAIKGTAVEATASSTPAVPLGRPVETKKQEATQREEAVASSQNTDFSAKVATALQGIGRRR